MIYTVFPLLVGILSLWPYCYGWTSSYHNRFQTSATSFLSSRGKTEFPCVSLHSLQMSKEDSCKDFTLLVCRSTSCAKQRRILGLDEFHTLVALDSQKPPELANVEIEETSCLGQCNFGPCVSVEHIDYDGPVALEGMNDREFNARVFCRILTDEDVGRVWNSIDTAVELMMDELDTETSVNEEVASGSV